MKAKELIKHLLECDLNAEVVIPNPETNPCIYLEDY